MQKIVSVVGARPQFIKAATVSRILRKRCNEILVHTGQHYDDNMSAIFFNELEIPEPDYYLSVGSGSHAWQTGQMLMRIEDVLVREQPDGVVVYGDTNSTLAGALAAAKLGIPIAHVEAGLRSYNRSMPEEINRVLTDHASSILFCPTRQAVNNLVREGFEHIAGEGRLVAPDYCYGELLASADRPLVINTGDVMYDALLYYLAIAGLKSSILQSLGLQPKEYCLATVHRAENTGDPARLQGILGAFRKAGKRVVLPLHPRTRQAIDKFKLTNLLRSSNIVVTEPVSYLDNLMLEKNAAAIVTDSGGMQKEAYLLNVPCITLRQETEWVETVEAGANVLAGTDGEAIVKAMETPPDMCACPTSLYGAGAAAENIAACLLAANKKDRD